MSQSTLRAMVHWTAVPLACLLLTGAVQAAVVTITGGRIDVVVQDFENGVATGNGLAQYYGPFIGPERNISNVGKRLTPGADDIYANLNIQWGAASGVTTLLNTFGLKRGEDQSDASSVGGSEGVNFKVDVDTPYALSGRFAADGGGTVRIQSALLNITGGFANLFFYQGVSNHTIAEILDLADPTGGDTTNVTRSNNSLTGTLLAGNTYRWMWESSLTNFSGPVDAGAMGSGFHKLIIGAPATNAVPEPGTLPLLALAAFAALAVRRPQRPA